MIGRVALLITFKKAKPKPQSLSRSHIRDLAIIQKNNDMKKIFALLGIFFLSQSLSGQNKQAYVSLSGGQPLENGRLHYDYLYFTNAIGCDTLICSGPGYEPGIFQSLGVINSEVGLFYHKIFNDAIIAVSDYILDKKELSGVLELEIRERKVRIVYSNGLNTGEASMYIEILD